MKIVSKLLVITLVVALLGVSSFSSAEAAGKFPSYSSGIQLQNLSALPATVTLVYYNEDGSVDTTFVDPTPIAGLGSRTYFPVHASVGFTGSVVVSSDQQLAAISNVLGNGPTLGSAAYVAPTQGSTTVNLPLLMKGNSGYDTWYSVQNAGSGDATVNVTYSDGTTVGPVTIEQGASHIFDQAAETHSAKVFSAVITSDVPVAAVTMEESTKLIFAYTGSSAGVTNPVMPLINANNSGFVTGIQIQNTSDTASVVTVTYTPGSAGTACTETQTIAGKTSSTFALYSFGGNAVAGMTTTCVKQKFIGSAEVTANSTNAPLIAIVNQLGTNSGEAYTGFSTASATSKVVFPLVMDRNSSWWTGFSVMNVGETATSVSCVFTNTAYTFSADLDPSESATDLQLNKIADKYVGSATCTASAGGLIVGVLNETQSGSTADTLLVYEGINAP